MRLFFSVLFAVVILLLAYRFLLYKKKKTIDKSVDKSVTYICDECGEKDCICHKESDIK